MCLIIHKPASRQIDPDFLREGWRRNADGWGCFHLHEGRPVWSKGLHLDELLACNAALPAHQEVYLHLRQATFGAVNHDMAHPFVVREGVMLMHNGSIHALAPDDTSVSDSAELARLLGDLMTGLDDEQAATLVRSEGFARLLAPLVGTSRVVVLDRRGVVRLGKHWHALSAADWSLSMQGIEVSNTHAWQPRSQPSARPAPSWNALLGALGGLVRGLAVRS